MVIWLRNKATRNLAKYSHNHTERNQGSVGGVHGEMIELGEDAK